MPCGVDVHQPAGVSMHSDLELLLASFDLRRSSRHKHKPCLLVLHAMRHPPPTHVVGIEANHSFMESITSSHFGVLAHACCIANIL